jgi:hypothetical protein
LIHTHPGNSPLPSTTDEDAFGRVFKDTDWAVMFILACDGSTYARLEYHTAPEVKLSLPVVVDYRRAFQAADHAAWQAEYERTVFRRSWTYYSPKKETKDTGIDWTLNPRKNLEQLERRGSVPQTLFDDDLDDYGVYSRYRYSSPPLGDDSAFDDDDDPDTAAIRELYEEQLRDDLEMANPRAEVGEMSQDQMRQHTAWCLLQKQPSVRTPMESSFMDWYRENFPNEKWFVEAYDEELLEDEDEEPPTAEDLGITLGSIVYHDKLGECQVIFINKDGDYLNVMDASGKRHRYVELDEVELIEKADPATAPEGVAPSSKEEGEDIALTARQDEEMRAIMAAADTAADGPVTGPANFGG